MASAMYFDINDHFSGELSRIKNINPDRYSYIDLPDDVTQKALSHLPSDRGVVITLYCNVPGTTELMVAF